MAEHATIPLISNCNSAADRRRVPRRSRPIRPVPQVRHAAPLARVPRQ